MSEPFTGRLTVKRVKEETEGRSGVSVLLHGRGKY